MKKCYLQLIGVVFFFFAWVDAVGEITTFETGKTPLVEIHVTETGNDQSGDGSLGSPFRSIRRAARDALPGSAIRLHAGNYDGGTSVAGLTGTEARPIWIGGVPGEAKPVFDSGNVGLHLSRIRYVVLHDMIIQNATSNGINTDDGGEYANHDATRHIVFRSLEVYDIGGSGNQDCLKLSGVNDFFVLDSVFARCGGQASGSGIDQVGCHNGHIQGNYFESMSGNAIQAKGGSENIRIHANMVVDGGHRAFNIGGSTGFEYFRPPLSKTKPNAEARNIRVTANVIVGSEAPFAFVGALDSFAANNTIIDPNQWLLRILQETTSSHGYNFLACANNSVTNNLFYFDRSQLSSQIDIGANTDSSSFSFANNLWFAHDNPAQSEPLLPVVETDGIVGRPPLMAAPGSGDYRIKSISPAVGGGQSLPGVDEDYGGQPYNDPPSIGAYEGNPVRSADSQPLE